MMATKKKRRVRIPKRYRPKESEKFMNPVMTEYFRCKLQGWKDELLRDSNETIQDLQTESLHEADIADRASTETDRSLLLRTRERERKLISKIDAALSRIDEGSYGYCEETMDRSASSAWRRGRSRRCRSRRRSATSGWSEPTGATEHRLGRLSTD
jgi:DnaK suppressor protein